MKRSTRLKASYWPRTRRMTIALLGAWALATILSCLYANTLNTITFLGFPLGFYMAAQGLLLFFLAIVGFYALYMDRIEAEMRRQTQTELDEHAD